MKISSLSLPEYVEFISHVPMDSIFQYPQYHYIQELIHPESVRFEPFRIEDGDKTILVPLIIEEKTKGYPEYIVPFNSVISDKTLTDDDYTTILDTLARRRPFMVRIRASVQNPHPFSEAARSMKLKISEKSTYLIDLPPIFEDWLSMLSANTRYKVKKRMNRAESTGLSVRQRVQEGLDDFLRLFYMRFHDNPEVISTLPAVFFHKLFSQLPPDAVKFHEVCFQEKVIASWVLMYGAPECFAHSSAFDKDYKDLYAGDLLNAHVMKHLIESGHKRFNLGGTGKSDTISVFKEKSGAREFIYDQAVWKNKTLSFRKNFHFSLSGTFSVKKHFLIKQDLLNAEPAPELPPGVECYFIENMEDLESLLAQGYSLKGKDERDKTFMNESIARARVSEKQTLNLVFRHKFLAYTRSIVFPGSLKHVKLIPPFALQDKEAFAWHANTPVFFRMLGHHKIFTQHVKYLLKQKGVNAIYLSVRCDNTPSLKAHLDTGGTIIKSFYVVRLKKKVWCIGRLKDS